MRILSLECWKVKPAGSSAASLSSGFGVQFSRHEILPCRSCNGVDYLRARFARKKGRKTGRWCRDKESRYADTEHANSGVTVIVKQESAASHQPTATDSQEDIDIQRQVAGFTKWLVIVGFIQAAILALTVWAVNRQTKAQRAWVSVDIEWDRTRWSDGKFHRIEGSGTSGDQTLFEAVLTCRNEGKSPAWIDEKRAKCELFTMIPEKPNLAATEIVQLGPEPIGIGQAIPHTTKIPMFMGGVPVIFQHVVPKK